MMQRREADCPEWTMVVLMSPALWTTLASVMAFVEVSLKPRIVLAKETESSNLQGSAPKQFQRHKLHPFSVGLLSVQLVFSALPGCQNHQGS